MRFNKNGKFKIMQITDIQEIPNISSDTLALIERAVEVEKPDLVVLTGDQIKGYSRGFRLKGKSLENVVYKTIEDLLEPVTKRNIPYAVTFGNHDMQVGLSNAYQFNSIYKKIGNCVGEQAEGINGAGTCNIPIYSSTDERVVSNLYLFNSGGDAKGGGYEPFDTEIIKWYQHTRDELKRENNGCYVPSVVFQHIPMDEYYNVLKQVPRNTKGAIRAFRTHKNEYYLLGDTCGKNDVLLEPPSVPNENTGEFDAISECGDVMAVFVGHDHKNNFVGTYKGVDLGFTTSCGFNCYGNRTNRGVRIIELDEAKPNEYVTYTRAYKDLVGKRLQKPILDYLSYLAPETVDATFVLVLKSLWILFALIGFILLRIPFGKLAPINFIGYGLCFISLFVGIFKLSKYVVLKKGE